MPILRAQCVFPHASGLAQNAITNTFHFTTAVTTLWHAEADAGNTLLHDFYLAINTTCPIRDDYVPEDAVVKWYNLSDPAPRVPYTTDLGFSGGAGSNATVPSEVAVVLSFQAALVSGVPQARRRGRVFIGGRNNLVIANTSTQPPRVHPLAQEAIRDAGAGLRAASQTANLPWSVFSQTNGTADPVVSGWVDDELDTQRRRGFRATNRLTFSA